MGESMRSREGQRIAATRVDSAAAATWIFSEDEVARLRYSLLYRAREPAAMLSAVAPRAAVVVLLRNPARRPRGLEGGRASRCFFGGRYSAETSRSDAVAATWIFRGDESRRRAPQVARIVSLHNHWTRLGMGVGNEERLRLRLGPNVSDHVELELAYMADKTSRQRLRVLLSDDIKIGDAPRVAAYVRRAEVPLMNRGDAATATWIVSGDGVAATPWPRRG